MRTFWFLLRNEEREALFTFAHPTLGSILKKEKLLCDYLVEIGGG